MECKYRFEFTLNQSNHTIHEPGHSISYKIACVPSKDSNRPALLYSLISVCCVPEDAFATECSAKTDQTVGMCRLI